MPGSAPTTGGISSIRQRGTYTAGIFDEGAGEIGTFDPEADRLFVDHSSQSSTDFLSSPDNVIEAARIRGGGEIATAFTVPPLQTRVLIAMVGLLVVAWVVAMPPRRAA